MTKSYEGMVCTAVYRNGEFQNIFCTKRNNDKNEEKFP